MKYKEFREWCNDRASDGCWGMLTAMSCISIVVEVNKIPFWKREKVWKEKYEEEIMRDIVYPIEKKIERMEDNNE